MRRNGNVARIAAEGLPSAMLEAIYSRGATGGVIPPRTMVIIKTVAKCTSWKPSILPNGKNTGTSMRVAGKASKKQLMKAV